uniref:Transacting enoyl reductase putative n=1 Tax=Albugo laibachii Nc14 TaxID=890382 RepID=F0WLB0_9STRA|nr:transacting enoyl reductase putative [Albugo laibachii Nc14]|eukprot:CCA22072.1 transacting enoyl reductase putative [Albugo laibachii Nc14]
MTSKPFDFVVYGASGLTGALITRYLLSEGATSMKWALAGRSEEKLRSLLQNLKKKLPNMDSKDFDNVKLLLADSHDKDSLLQMVKSTKVVLTVVGPYTLHGTLLLQLCAENGVHYCDLTGELVWVKKMMERFGTVAAKTGARIVPFCGYEAIPADITTFMITNAIEKKFHSKTSKVSFNITGIRGMVSGGTCASMFALMDTSTSEELKKLRNPFMLAGDDVMQAKESNGLVKENQSRMVMSYDKDIESWTTLSIGGSIDSAVVHLSNFLLNNRYGDRFVYHERFALNGFFFELTLTIALYLLGIMIYFRWTRAILKRFAPAPSQEASDATIQNGFFVASALGYKEDGQLVISASINGQGDPGYGFTSRVIAECAMLLAQGKWNPDSPAARKGGFYTPASAFGSHLSDRLAEKNLISIQLREHLRF